MNDKVKAKRAFPVVDDQGRGLVCADDGMTLRDWFAGQAMNGLMSDPSVEDKAANIALVAYHVADEMMKARDAG